jgi:hypothetical protein
MAANIKQDLLRMAETIYYNLKYIEMFVNLIKKKRFIEIYIHAS